MAIFDEVRLLRQELAELRDTDIKDRMASRKGFLINYINLLILYNVLFRLIILLYVYSVK